MRKLLSAGFARLWKNKYFWICVLCMTAFAAVIVISSYISAEKYDSAAYLDGILLCYITFIGVVIAAFISLFIGTEYSDGTIRNKLIVGHRRSAIYISNFIISSVASIIISASFMLTITVIGLPLKMILMSEASTILVTILSGFVLCLSFTGIFTLVAMLCQNKAAVAVICVVSAFALLMVASYLVAALSEPELINEYYYDAQTDDWIMGELVPNQRYVGGIKREIFEFLNDFLPGGQAIQISQAQIDTPWLLQCYSAIIAIGSSLLGLELFKRKDLK